MRTIPITLAAVDDVSIEAAHALHWRPVADRWPAGAPAPALRVATLAELALDPAPSAGGAVLALLHTEDAEALAPALADRLLERNIPALFLLADDAAIARLERLACEGVFLARIDDEPASNAATLRTLAQRQPAVDAAVQELAMNRRFSNGMRAQMERLSEELMLASFVQRDFLPKTLPAFGGLDFGVFFRPAGYVSGDIYDVIRLDEHHAGFFLADVIGHGVPAALLTMVIQKSLPTKEITGSTYRLVPPAEALTRLNIELIRQQGESARFASAVYGVIDVRDRSVTIAGAGHPPPLRFRASGETDKIETSGGLLGVFAEEVYQQTSFTLEPDDSLLLYTDGFETAFPDAGADAYGRRTPTTHYLSQFATLAADARSGLPLDAAMTDLAQRLDQQPGSLHQIDDLTAIALSCDPARTSPGPGARLDALAR